MNHSRLVHNFQVVASSCSRVRPLSHCFLYKASAPRASLFPASFHSCERRGNLNSFSQLHRLARANNCVATNYSPRPVTAYSLAAIKCFSTMTTQSATLRLPRKLIVLCDGTWQNSADPYEKGSILSSKGHLTVPTNVTRMARAIKPEDSNRHPQVVYYQAGVGSSSWSTYDQLAGGALAYGLSENVREAYSFIVDNLLFDINDNIKDEIFLVGFSRGAFTARSIGGMIASIGVLTKEAMDYFYYIFQDFENAGSKEYVPKMPTAYSGFKLTADPMNIENYINALRDELVSKGLTRIVDIQAIAVWDTVGTLGLPIQPWLQKMGLPTTLHKYRFYDTGVSKTVKHAFQALALDEDRSAFQAAVWEKEEDNDVTDLRQVWFAGVHSNIGGGYDDHSQSDLTFAWMVSQLKPLLEFDDDYILNQFAATKEINEKAGLGDIPWGLGTIYESNTFPTSMGGSEQRTPDRYHRLVYQTGKPTPDLLKDTNEKVHASVRARCNFGGVQADLKTPYKTSSVLSGWALESRKDADGKSKYVWTYGPPGKDTQCFKREMEEAELSEFELQLLKSDPAMFTSLFPQSP